MKLSIAKKLCAFLLIGCLIFSSIPMSAFAQETDVTDTPVVEDVVTGENTEQDDTTTEGDIENRKEIDISSSEELENALTSGYNYIRVVADFMVDRTFYITYDTTIYTDEAHTLNRDANFAGDIFVVGEDSEGQFSEEPATLNLGKKTSKENDLLKIDGNKENLTCAVSGTVVFVCPNAANRTECFTGMDSTHPNEAGRQMIAENMAKKL